MIEDLLYREHSRLALRYFTFGLSAKERMKFNHIRWHLDQIECQQLRDDFKRMDAEVERKAALGKLVHDFADSISEIK